MADKKKCGACGGSGTVTCDCAVYGDADGDCIACGGRGKHTCPSCRGSGYER